MAFTDDNIDMDCKETIRVTNNGNGPAKFKF